MIKNDWIKVIEKCFKEIHSEKKWKPGSLRSQIEKLKIKDDDLSTSLSFPVLPPNSRIFVVEADKTITIITKEIVDQGSPHLFWGEYIIVQSEIETCIIGDSIGISFIPWTEITVITTTEAG